MPIHKAAPDARGSHCAVCGQRIKRVPGGHGPTWVHSDTGFVAAPSPPSGDWPLVDLPGIPALSRKLREDA